MTAAQRLALHGSEAVHVCRWLAPALLRRHAWHRTSCMGAVAQARRNCQQNCDAGSHRWALRTPLTAVSTPLPATPASSIRWRQQRSVKAAAAAAPAAELAADTSGECLGCPVMHASFQSLQQKHGSRCNCNAAIWHCISLPPPDVSCLLHMQQQQQRGPRARRTWCSCCGSGAWCRM